MSPTPDPFPPLARPLARPLGYALVVVGLIVMILIAAFIVHEVTRSSRTIQVRFPEIATLAEGDPVVQGGVTVGKVLSIRLPPTANTSNGNPEALVVLELDHHRPLPRGTRFINFSHSLMGARKVWIELGPESGGSTPPLDETPVQKGIFVPGLAETLHKVDSMVVLVARVRLETERLLAEDNPLRSPFAALQRLDSAAEQLNRISGRLESARATLEAGLSGFTSAAKSVRQGVRAAEPPIRSSLRQAREWVSAIESVQENLESLLTEVEKISSMAQDTTKAGLLLNNREVYEKLEKSVILLQATARLLEKDGLPDSVTIRPRLRSHQ